MRTARAVPTPWLCRNTMISRTAFCSAHAAVMRLDRTARRSVDDQCRKDEWFGDQRPGDNLYTSSTLALDGDTGKIKGYFQYHQNESWDWDEMNAPMLVDLQANGATTKGLLKPARNGYLYWLKRDADGSIAYLRSQAFVPQNVFTSIDKETGRPDVNRDRSGGCNPSAVAWFG
jgi:hypothetical protein